MAHGVAAEWTSTPVANTSEVILYLHGGGYAWGSLKSHRHIASEVGRSAAMTTLAIDYKRAPEFPFPHALDDAVSGYKFLLDSGFKPRQIVVAGDSAGAGLAVALLVRLKELAPLTIFVGSTESLLDDAVGLARAAGLADVGVRLEIWPKMFHIWPNYHQVLAQGRQGVDRAGRLLREAVDAAHNACNLVRN